MVAKCIATTLFRMVKYDHTHQSLEIRLYIYFMQKKAYLRKLKVLVIFHVSGFTAASFFGFSGVRLRRRILIVFKEKLNVVRLGYFFNFNKKFQIFKRHYRNTN